MKKLNKRKWIPLFPYQLWTKEEDEILKKEYSNKKNKDISKILDRSVGSIQARGILLNLKKEMNFISKIFKGRRLSADWKKKMGNSKWGEKNPIWKGDKVKCDALHAYIRRHKPKPELCERCHKNKPYDLANISGKYKRDVNDFEWICRSCHMKSDGRINNLKQYQNEKNKNRNR